MKSNTFLCLICSILMIFVLTYPERAISAATDSMHLWSISIFPSLFPFFVLSSILKQTGLIELAIYKSSKKFDYNLTFTTIIGFMCGYPSTSKLIGQNETDNPLQLYALSTAPSPIFIVGTVATVFLQNTVLAIYLLIATYLSLITSYFIIKKINKKDKYKHITVPKISTNSLDHIITTAILDGVKSQAIILGIIIVVSIISVFLETINAFTYIAKIFTPFTYLLNIPDSAIIPFVKGLLEMTTGVNAICAQNISVYHKLALCGFITSFGGMSIILESISFINSKIKATSIVLVKLLHGILTYMYIRLLLFMFPIFQSVAYTAFAYTISPALLFGTSSACSVIILAVLHRISHREL